MELFKLYGSIMVDSDQAQKSIRKTTDEASSFSSKLGTGIKVAAKLGAAVVGVTTAAASSIALITKSAIQSYAEYEQLIGGVETLFKDSSDIVMGYAEEAYKTAGLSANQYMKTVTGFSASLLQSLGGDTKKAAEVADLAIKDMSDNANKMGTSMESIQNAYQGFAKQNYTMLDNLKLGYGGTKSEMERLLEDAEKLKTAQGEIVDYSIDSYADIIDAIHTIQVEMDIYGTTSQEASSTIQGSFESMKTAWQNFITGMADEDQDFDILLNNLTDSIVTFGKNIIPRIEQTVPRIIKGLSGVVKIMIPYVPKVLNELVPALYNGAQQILKLVIDDLPDMLGELFGDTGRQFGETISTVVSDIVPIITNLAETVMPIVIDVFHLFSSALSAVVPVVEMVAEAIDNLHILDVINGIMEVAGGVISVLTWTFKDNTVAVSENVKAAREAANAAREESQAFRDMKAAVDEKAAADLSNISNTERLWSELQKLTDETGKVSESDRARAEFIIGELNDALGTEIEMVDGQIQSYEELQESIANTIEMKKAEIMLQANEEAYTEAVKNCNEQKRKSGESYTAWRKAQSEANRLYDELEALKAQETANMFDGTMHQRVVAAEEAYNEQAQIAANLHSTYDESADLYAEYCSTIEKYEAASVAMQQGNAEEVMNIYDRKGQAMLKAADIAGQATEQQKQQFLEQAQQMSAEYAFLAEEYLKGSEGITEKMVQDAGVKAELAWSEYQKVGGSMSDGIISGALSGSDAVNKAIMAIVTNGLNAGQGAATTYSSSTGTSNYVPKSANTTQNASWYAQTYGGRAHAKGGIVKKGEIAFLEGEGTEAVVPLEKNKEWISRVAEDMNSSIAYNVGNVSNKTLEDIYELMKTMAINLPEMMADAMASVKLGVDKREFGRLVRQVNA